MTASVAEILLQEKIAVIATDTLYGIVGRALSKSVVERIYEVKGRDENKPFIILIPSIETLKEFGIVLSESEKEKAEALWPGAVTIILPLPQETQKQFSYLHRRTNTLAFRMPNKRELIDLLKETGPLVAPSANPQGKSPAITIEEARSYFGDMVDHYEDAGDVESEPSTIICLEKGEVAVIRQGAARIV
ncbi:MAG TPA: L-threonylcarbamoyladenylate synthase [Candidatus Paceibacterota bacterium]